MLPISNQSPVLFPDQWTQLSLSQRVINKFPHKWILFSKQVLSTQL